MDLQYEIGKKLEELDISVKSLRTTGSNMLKVIVNIEYH